MGCKLFAFLVAAAGLCAASRAHADEREAPAPAPVPPEPATPVRVPEERPPVPLAKERPALVERPSAAKVSVVVRRWYGWEPLVADGATFTAASAFRSPAILFGGYLVGAPAIHLLRGKPANAAKSFGARALLPAAGALAGCLAGDAFFVDQHQRTACAQGAGMGLFAGMIGAIAIDAAALSIDPVRREIESPKKPSGTALLPGVAFVSGGARVEVRGTF